MPGLVVEMQEILLSRAGVLRMREFQKILMKMRETQTPAESGRVDMYGFILICGGLT